MTLPLHNFLTVHNDNKECVKLMFWNANKSPGKTAAETRVKQIRKTEKRKKGLSSPSHTYIQHISQIAHVQETAGLLHEAKKKKKSY